MGLARCACGGRVVHTYVQRDAKTEIHIFNKHNFRKTRVKNKPLSLGAWMAQYTALLKSGVQSDDRPGAQNLVAHVL